MYLNNDGNEGAMRLVYRVVVQLLVECVGEAVLE